MEKVLDCIKAFADIQRFRILVALSDGELCLCSLQEILRLSASTVSRHVAILKNIGLVVTRTEGKWRYFSLAPEIEDSLGGSLLIWVMGKIEEDPAIDEFKRVVSEMRNGQGLRCSSSESLKRECQMESRGE